MQEKYIVKVNAPGISKSATDALRAEIVRSLSEPDNIIVTNYNFTVDIIPVYGAQTTKKRKK